MQRSLTIVVSRHRCFVWKRGKQIDRKSRASLQPSLHPDLLYSAPRVCKPGGELREIHARVEREILLLGFRRVRVGLVVLDPFHEHGRVPHPSHRVCADTTRLQMRVGALFEMALSHNTRNRW